MLHEFLTSNREDLIARCGEKVARRRKRSGTPPAAEGVPLFLQQLADTLRSEAEAGPKGKAGASESPPPSAEISRAASLHGADLLRRGYSVDQVVRDYGDVCQAVTELAIKKKALITTAEFRTLNRCLDDAIAEAVTTFGSASQAAAGGSPEATSVELKSYLFEQYRLLDTAIQCYAAIKSGDVGITGATGTLLIQSLNELRTLADRLPPEFGLATPAPRSTPTSTMYVRRGSFDCRISPSTPIGAYGKAVVPLPRLPPGVPQHRG